MKPVTTASAPAQIPLRPADDQLWRDRAGRLFAEFERPAKGMIRRAFRGAFCADELDDIYAGAWVGTLRALAARHAQLTDEEIRSYLLTAVANQAGKELRRRRRKPTAPLEAVSAVPDDTDGPEEQVAGKEQSRIARDLLTTLPPRRRAVMLLRYGWGLEPSQVCGLISGLSPRAYRKEITRGVDELTERMRAVESGKWCADREPVLKAFVAGTADEDQERQARAHLSHCHPCSDFVARLGGHLHDLGGSIGALGAIHGLDGGLDVRDRLHDLGDRAASLVGRGGSDGASEPVTQMASTGGARGAGAAGAGILTKVATLGAAGKIAIACVGGGIAATACVAAGVAPFGLGADRAAEQPRPERVVRPSTKPAKPPELTTETLPSQVGNESIPVPAPATSDGAAADQPATEATPRSEPDPEPEATAPTVAPTAPPEEQEFGVAAAATTPPAPTQSPAPASGGGGASAGGAAPTPTQAAQQEFGP